MAQPMQEGSVADPPLLPDQLVMHDGNGGGRSAEADPFSASARNSASAPKEGRSSVSFDPRYRALESGISAQEFSQIL